VYAGLSRKRMIGTLTGRATPADRAAGSVAAALIAVQRGARIVRVHDVLPTVDALAVWSAVQAADTVPRRDDRPAAPRWPDDD
jgi:dihydropteroate synthase